MAMAMPVSTAAEKRANFLRLAALVIDGGALALKTQFDAIFSPHSLTQDLQIQKKILKNLGRVRVLSRFQLDLLLPAPPVNADSSKFDVCLFACLIQNLPVFGQKHSPVWGQRGLPPPVDQSLAADVQRLRFMRNQLCHATEATITDQEFNDKSQEVIGAIQRQGQTNPDVQTLLFDFQNKTIDPAMEKEYLEKLKDWERFDRQLHEALEELQEKVDVIEGEVAECKEGITKNDQAIQNNTAYIEEKSKILEEHKADMERITTRVDDNAKYIKENKEKSDGNIQENKDSIETLRVQLEDSKAVIEENRNKIEENRTTIKLNREGIQINYLETNRISEEMDLMQKAQEKDISSQYKALFGNSKLFFQSKEKNEFIETHMYKEAQKRLDENKIVIITGHPGEGKSCMAKQLLLTRFAADRCLNITHSTDWDHVNLYAKQPDAILIDDIFGVRAFDKGLFDYWEKKLTDLLRAVKKYNIYVILTSRHYILEESKVLVKTVPPFDQKENFILLSSNELMDDEKVQILESHLKAEERRINKDSVKNCIVNHADFQRTLFRKHRFKFGFPQCAALYSRRDDLFNERGENFFINPNTFFKQCIEQLSEHEQNFLALILLWVIPKQELHRSKINDYLTSEEIKLISKELHFEMNGDLVRSLRKSLESHIGGVLHFSNETGIFTFSHSVISDMIGLVTAKQKTEFVVKHGATEFLFNFLAFEGDEDEYEFHVPAYLYDERLQTIKQLKEKIKQLKEKIEKPGQELGKLKQDIEKLDQEREKLDQEREKLDQDKEKLDQKRKKLDQDKKKLDQEREKLDQEREKLELEIEKQTLELIKILQEIDKMEQKRVQMKKMSQFDLKQMRNRRVKLK